ncbi:MAG: hypothetical protein JXR96_05045 [Deltaproteobacteria bacterium]|nr:hypothetical protein [Deltaproteobacteria bacterium]
MAANKLRVAFACVLVLVPLGIACECGDSNLQSGKPQIEVEPNPIVFEGVAVGTTHLEQVALRNTGTAPLLIQSLAVEGDEAYWVDSVEGVPLDEISFPLGIAHSTSGASVEALVQLAFAPEQVQEYGAELVVISDAENEPELRVPILGQGSLPDIDVEPASLEFDGVPFESSASHMLTVHNRGGARLDVVAEDMELQSEEESPPFLFHAQDMRLNAGEQASIEVVYSPREPHVNPITLEQDPDEAVLLIYSNDPDESPLEVPLWGMAFGNLPPLVGVRVESVTLLDGTPLEELCAMAPSDTIRFAAVVSDPEDEGIQPSFLDWQLEQRPDGSSRSILDSDAFHPTFKPDLSGGYTVCLTARDVHGMESDRKKDCDCEYAKTAAELECQCVHFEAFPREDIRIELTWDILGPDLDLHLIAPAGVFCSPTQDCRHNPIEPDDPDWTRTACVDSTCRTPNCDPSGCELAQDCYDNGGGPVCYWQTCSGTDCFWNARHPDWGVPGDESDDPLLAIDCTHGCRVETVNINEPEPGIYRVAVNYYEPFRGTTEATVRIYFKGDLEPTVEYQDQMTAECDTWQVAQIDWHDHENHPVTYQGGAHSSSCCR